MSNKSMKRANKSCQKNKMSTKDDEFYSSTTNANDYEDGKVSYKADLHLLNISEDATKMVLDTLKFINGEDFSTKKLSAYKDKKINLSRNYWTSGSNLVVKGVLNYSLTPKDTEEQIAHKKVNQIAVAKLKTYGFPKSHCVEALDAVGSDVGVAYELLMEKYFHVNQIKEGLKNREDSDSNLSCISKEQIVNDRLLEVETLNSIYGDSFCEVRIANQLWVVHLDLPHLIQYFENKKKKLKVVTRLKRANSDDYLDNKNLCKLKDVCKYFLSGNCKFGNRCNKPHTREVKMTDDSNIVQCNSKCNLEVRFPQGCQYPYRDIALVSIYSIESLIPEECCLKLSAHLMQLMVKNVEMDLPSIYSLIDFLMNNEKEVIDICESINYNFIKPSAPLIPNNNNNNNGNNIEVDERKIDINSEFYVKREKDLNNSENVDFTSDNDKLCKKFKLKQNEHKYNIYLKGRKKLPAWSKMNTLLDTISNNQIVIISGETGCGKSTQVPQFVLDDWLLNRNVGTDSHCSIVCTQPRRISALAVASRVAEERTESVGDVVGYQIRLESCVSSNTRLLFCTTGILLRKLEIDSQLKTVTHIVVDEVHERSCESDFLLMILKDLLSIRPDLKLILMSATMNAECFSQYFGDVPVIDIPGRTFPVEQLYLEDIMDATGYVLEEDSDFSRHLSDGRNKNDINIDLETCDIQTEDFNINDKIKDENLTMKQLCHRFRNYSKQVCKNLYLMDPEKINYEFIEEVLVWITSSDNSFPKTGTILIFLPGLQEISTMLNRLKDSKYFGRQSSKYVLIPLHSTLTNEEQTLVFKKFNNGVRKIIMSTNIAETSITIDDCTFVIDSGKMKETRFDSNKNMESLETMWVSRANALQRKGRAGRVMPGVCIHLYTSHRMNYNFLARPIPEIHRVPLEQLIIRIKILPLFSGIEVQQVFAKMLEPPKADDIENSLKRLYAVGALDKENSITPLGKHLSALPVDVRIGKLILYGAIFCCLDSVLTIAACLSYRSPFISPFKSRKEADSKKKEFSSAQSDQITVLKAYNAWRDARKKSRMSGNTFAKENFLSWQTLSTLVDIKRQFLHLLISIGFVSDHIEVSNFKNKGSGIDNILEITGQQINCNCKNEKLLIGLLCAALYPNVVKILRPEKLYSANICGAIPKGLKVSSVKFKTKKDGYVDLHPSSVNYEVTEFKSPYLLYQEKIRTSRVFIRDCSIVPIVPLVLFSGSVLDVQLNNGQFVISLEDGWIMFPAQSNQVAELLQALQVELFRLLDEKIEDPKLNLIGYGKGEKIINTITYLVTHG